MERRTRTVLIAAAGAAVAIAATTAAVAVEREDGGSPITGDALARASAAALAHTGGGRVTGSEDGDEESRYEVEVTLDDGRQVDVQLDADFHVVGSSTDDDAGEAGDG